LQEFLCYLFDKFNYLCFHAPSKTQAFDNTLNKQVDRNLCKFGWKANRKG